MKVADAGEFKLIEMLTDLFDSKEAGDLVIGPGDDAAAWRVHEGTMVATTDTLVEGVHFAWGTWEDRGWKSLAVNLSDVAAMGAIPQYALLSLSMPAEMDVEDMLGLALGMKELARLHGVSIVGGNVSQSPVTVITMTVLGQAHAGRLLTRGSARPGDLLAVTGYLGSSAGGLRLLKDGVQVPESKVSGLVKAHLRPQPRIAEGQALVECGVRTAIDISDGLIADLGHICQRSRVGAAVEAHRIPVLPELKEVYPGDYLAMALTGGEDYELLFAAEEGIMQKALTALAGLEGGSAAVIGRIHGGTGVKIVNERGSPLQIEVRGWEHFAKGR